MDLRDVALACLRRWYVVVAVAVLFGVLVVDQRAAARPAYQVESLVAVVPSPSLTEVRDGAAGTERPGDTNPFGSPATVALYLADLAEARQDQDEQVQISWSGLEPTLVRVLVTTPDANSAAVLSSQTMGDLRAALAALQDAQAVAPTDRFELLDGAGSINPVRVVPSARRLTVVITVSGILAAATIATALDNGVRRRRQRPTVGEDRRPRPPERSER